MCIVDYFIRILLNAIHFALYAYCFHFIVNISPLWLLYRLHIQTDARTCVQTYIRQLNCLVSHAENISGLSVQLLKTLQQVVFNFPRTQYHNVIAGQTLINMIFGTRNKLLAC